jgi:cytochrome P450
MYNIFLHPLRGFPGPILGRATNLTWGIQSSRGRSVLWMHGLHQKYGPVVRYGPNKLSSIEAETWKEVYGHHTPQWPKDPNFFGPDPYGGAPGLIRADDHSHSRQRKLVSHAFSDKALREQQHVVRHYVSLLVEKLEQDANKHNGRVNLVSWFNFTTFDVMADLTFGESLNQLAGSMYSPWVGSIFSHIRSLQLLQIAAEWQPFTNILGWCFVPSRMKKEQQNVFRFSAEKVKARLSRQSEHNDIWSYILRHSDDKDERKSSRGLTSTEMLSNGQTFMTAGTETTATLLCGLFYYLLRDKQKHARLVNEVRDTFQTYEEMTMGRLAEQRYLQACIDEALRIYPPVAVGIPRMAPHNGSKFGPHFVPKGVGSNWHVITHKG